jgi:hypothetical protein
MLVYAIFCVHYRFVFSEFVVLSYCLYLVVSLITIIYSALFHQNKTVQTVKTNEKVRKTN